MSDDMLRGQVFDRLNARLKTEGPEPLALALSGGGDSRALLALVMEWARPRGRRVIALTVDHRLNPDSARWTEMAGQAARDEGAEWQAMSWDDAKGGSGVQARARLARHALLAEAARKAGACVILMGHTRDDVAENRWMQADGSNLGQLREWSPSPVWPEGRGIMLMRPLLGTGRQALRDLLTAQGKDWIDDPANDNPAYHRIRARQALVGQESAHDSEDLTPWPWQAGDWGRHGVLAFDRAALAKASGRVLAAALLSASGTVRPPRGDRLARVQAQVCGHEPFSAVLCGARIEASADQVLIAREAGEMVRSGLPPLHLRRQVPAVWDGRFEITAPDDGWTVLPARGLLSRLSESDRAALDALPPFVRASVPVLRREGSETVVAAFTTAEVTPLAPLRFCLNAPAGMGETTQEAGLFAALHSEKGSTALFSV
ncbi:MAG: tRNA lysidine(34) synthetase TilS [Janthinobacterium lividum]